MLQVNTNTRAGRMLEAGRLVVTLKSLVSGEHMTLKLRARTIDGGKWHGSDLEHAKVLFIEVPSNSWDRKDKVAKVTRRGGFQADSHADPARVWAAKQVLAYVAGGSLHPKLELKEEDRCGRCGRALTDPVSIERGIGPECYGKITGSHHQVKNDVPVQEVLV